MSFAKVASVGASSVDSGLTAVTSGINTTGAALLVAQIADFGSATSAVLTDSQGNTWTPLTARTDGAFVRSTLYYCLSPLTGSGHVFTATSPSGAAYPSIQVIAFSATTPTFDQQSGASATGTVVQPGSITPPSAGALFVTGLGYSTAEAGTFINSGFTLDIDNDFSGGNAEGGSLAFLIQGAAGALDPEWSWVFSSTVAASMATFIESGGGGGGGSGGGPVLQGRALSPGRIFGGSALLAPVR